MSDFIYGPEDFLGWAIRSGWKPSVLPVGVVYTFQAPVARAIEEQSDRFQPNTELTVSNARMFMTTDGDSPVLIACLNPGAASMVTQLEHLRFLVGDQPLAAVIVGTAGAIAGDHAIADTLIANAALASDGISPLYVGDSTSVDADPDLCAALGRKLDGVSSAVTWTVPVPYRSTPAALIEARSNGAELVEMEAAALFAASLALGIRAAAVLVVSDVTRVDEPTHVDWSDTLAPTMRAVDAAIEAIRSFA